MDCLICYRVYIPEIDYSIEVPERSSEYANSICKLLSIPFQPVFEDIFENSSICIKCHRRFDEVNKLIKELEVLQGKLIQFQEQIEVELLQSKQVGEIFDENETSPTTLTRCKLIEELKRYNALSSIEIQSVQSNYNDFSSNGVPTPNSIYDHHPLKSSHGSEASDTSNIVIVNQQNSDDSNSNGMVDMGSDIIENEDDGYCNTEVLNYLEDIEIDYHIDGPNVPDSSNDYLPPPPAIIRDVRIHVEPIQIPIETLRARSVNIHEEPLASYIQRDQIHVQELQNTHNFELSPMFVSRKRTKRFTDNNCNNGRNFDASLYEYNGAEDFLTNDDNEIVCKIEGCYFEAKNPRGLRIHKTLIHGYDIIKNITAQIKKEPLESSSSMDENDSQNEMNEGNQYQNDEFAEFMASNGVQTQLNEGIPQQLNVKRKRYGRTLFSNSRRIQEFRCKVCKKRLANKNSLSRHMISFHQGRNEIRATSQKKQIPNNKFSIRTIRTCNICKEICISKYALIKHMRVHSFKFFCQYCDKGFSKQKYYDNHNAGEANEELNCANCSDSFKNKNCLVYHNIKVHNFRFSCTICGKNFLKKYMFERHQKELFSHNSSGRIYSCKVCSMGFEGNACYRYHSRFVHPNKTMDDGNNSENDEDSHELESFDVTNSPSKMHTPTPQMKITTERIQFEDFSSPDNPLKCKVCQNILSSTKALQTHSLIHLNAQPYKCRFLCGLWFRHITARNRHEVVHQQIVEEKVVIETPAQEYKCRHLCGLKFNDIDIRSRHEAVHQPNAFRVVENPITLKDNQCSVCLRVFSTKSNLKTHFNNILASYETLKCRYCQSYFRSSACLAFHERQHKFNDVSAIDQNFVQIKIENIEENHGSPQQIEFENIDQLIEQTSSSSNVMSKQEKSSSSTFSCPIPGCRKAFLFNSRLKKHLTTHSNARPYVCKVEGCYKDFRTRGGLSIHSYDHVKNQPYSCKICSRTFAVFPLLKRHLSRTHIKIQMEQKEQILNHGNVNKKISSKIKATANRTNQQQKQVGEKCGFCNLSFINSTVLTDHINLVHTSQSQKTYTCSIPNCRKSFKTSKFLREHAKAHAKKGYKCEFCAMRLSTEALYFIHRNLHTKEKSYSCRDVSCGKVFYNPSTLYSHERSFHPNLKNLNIPRSKHPKVNHTSQSQSTSSTSNSVKKNIKSNFETAKFFCGVCHEQFNELEVLEEHLNFKCKKAVH